MAQPLPLLPRVAGERRGKPLSALVDAEPARRKAPPKGDPPLSPVELDLLAGNGESTRVYALLSRIPPESWPTFASPRVLRQAVVGGLSRLRALGPEALALKRDEAQRVLAILDLHVGSARSGGGWTRDLFRSLLDVSCYCFEDADLARADRLVDLGLSAGVIRYPEIYPRFVLHKASILAERSDFAGAESLLSGLHRRGDLVADRRVLPEISLSLARAALLEGQVVAYKRALFDGLRGFYPNLPERKALVDQLNRTYRGAGRLLAGDAAPGDKARFLLHRIFFGLRTWAGPGRRLLEQAFLGALYAACYRPRARPPIPAASLTPRRVVQGVLVTRAMGGLGDLLMMTPALHALRIERGEPVRLALPRRFFPLFETNDDVELVDIHRDLEPGAFASWINLTDCPAARLESLTAPRVRKNRIEIFARALGIRGPALRRLDRRPRYRLSAEEAEFRDRFFEEHGLRDRTVIGIQLRSEESYRDYPHAAALVRDLARDYAVLLFDEHRIDGFDVGNVIPVVDMPLRRAFALASGCRALVAPDSAFLHLSAAFGTPCVGLFGPTDGRVRSADYPLVKPLDARQGLPCVPCWRNEEIPCALTGRRRSACLGEISVPRIRAAVDAALGAASPPRGIAG